MYTSLYRTLMSPTIYNEWDGAYMGMDDVVHYVTPGENYFSDMSLWDSYRTQHPWLVLIRPDVARDVVRSLVLMIQQFGSLPRWCVSDWPTTAHSAQSHATNLPHSCRTLACSLQADGERPVVVHVWRQRQHGLPRHVPQRSVAVCGRRV